MENTRLDAVMDKLYQSEISCSVSCFWDGGWDAKLGNEMGYRAEGNFNTLGECAEFLHTKALECYPESVYTLGQEEWSKRQTGRVSQSRRQ